MNTRFPRMDRRGALAPLMAILTIPMMAMLAFSVDLSYIVLARTEVQAAADGGALAAAQSLQAGYIAYNQGNKPISTYTRAAATAAQTIVQANTCGGQYLVFNSSTDIEFGYTDPSSGTYSTPTNYYPNTVKVTARRDSVSGTPLNLFFGPVLGTKTANVTAAAGATLRTGTISPPTYAATQSGGFTSGILPLTYNVNWWNNFLQTGKNPDGSTPSVIDGLSFIIPFGGGGSSNQLGQANWGWLSLDDSHVGASTLSDWVNNGMSSSDYGALSNANLLPLSLHTSTNAPTNNSGPSGSFNWLGDNGAKVAVAHTINSDAGQMFLIPLYQPVFAPSSGSLPSGVNVGDAGIGGSNQFYFNIVAFAPVVIVYDGDNNTVAVAPSTSYPPGVTFSNQTVANTSAAQGTASSNSMIFVPAALTQ